jgi:hypothetical protein
MISHDWLQLTTTNFFSIQNGVTPLHTACQFGSAQVIEYNRVIQVDNQKWVMFWLSTELLIVVTTLQKSSSLYMIIIFFMTGHSTPVGLWCINSCEMQGQTDICKTMPGLSAIHFIARKPIIRFMYVRERWRR